MKSKNKKNGLAHIEWRNTSARIIFYYKGERYVRSLGAVSEDDADIARLQFVIDVKSGKVLPQSERTSVHHHQEMTFNQFAALWAKDRELTASAKTFHEDNRRLESRILPVLGSKTLKSLTGYDLDQFIKRTLAQPWQNGQTSFKPLSDQSRKHYFRQLHFMFQQAKAWGLIQENPMKELKAPTAKNKPTDYYSLEDLSNFWRQFYSPFTYHSLIIHLAWTLGLRREEICGLRWTDFIFESLTVTIENCRIHIPGTGTITKGTKNSHSRTVGLTPQVSKMMKRYKVEYDQNKDLWKKQWLGEELVFVNFSEKGKPYHPSTIDYWLPDYLAENNLPHITLQGFRHTMATLLHEAGMDTVTVSELLGHSTKQSNILGGYGMAPRVTRTYLHKSKNATTKMTEIMARLFGQVMLQNEESSQISSQAKQ